MQEILKGFRPSHDWQSPCNFWDIRLIIFLLLLDCLPLLSEVLQDVGKVHVGSTCFSPNRLIVTDCSCSNLQSFHAFGPEYIRRCSHALPRITRVWNCPGRFSQVVLHRLDVFILKLFKVINGGNSLSHQTSIDCILGYGHLPTFSEERINFSLSPHHIILYIFFADYSVIIAVISNVVLIQCLLPFLKKGKNLMKSIKSYFLLFFAP